MTAASVIEEIKRLPRDEQTQVVQFAVQLAKERQLSGSKLARLAEQLANTTDVGEVQRLKDDLTRGFYGD